MIRFENPTLRTFTSSLFAFVKRAIISALLLTALSVSSPAQIETHGQGVQVQKPGATQISEKPSTVAAPIHESDKPGTTGLPGESDLSSGPNQPLDRNAPNINDRLTSTSLADSTTKNPTESKNSPSPVSSNAGTSSVAIDADERDPLGTSPLFQEDWRKFDPSVASGTESENDDPAAAPVPERMFHWGRAIRQMLVMQAFQHSFALAAQDKTRRGLKGPFFSDYFNSVKGLHGWDDGNRFFTNYVAHPMQGATSGFIFIQNHERAKRQKFGESKEYWVDRLKTFAWAAAWSTNWELGPISQASIGNVGLNGGMGYVDLVITPVVGTSWTITEEAVDRYIIRHTEGKNLTRRILVRSFLNPMRSVANLLRLKLPWHRERDRPF